MMVDRFDLFRYACISSLLVLAVGCAEHAISCRPDPVRPAVALRSGQEISVASSCGQFVVPPCVNLEDGITEDEAIALALANNSTFQSLLTTLTMAEGDAIQAGLLTNPNLGTFFQVGVKQWEWTLYAPIEAYLLRPERERIANSDYQRIAHSLIQSGLTLVRDVRVAHTDLALAQQQLELASEAREIRQGIADLTGRRFERGEISDLESMTAKVDAATAHANIVALEQNVQVARNRLDNLLGMPYASQSTVAVPSNEWQSDAESFTNVDILIDEALRVRPDMCAANWAVTTAAHRAHLARRLFWRIDGVADANQKGEKGYEVGPGLRFDIPIFNRNQGGRLRSVAEWEQACRNRDVVRDQIVQEVRTAAAQVSLTNQNLDILNQDVVPVLDEALSIAKKGYEGGGAPYLLVLQATTQYLDARGRVLDQLAGLRRARAELERAVGHKLNPSSVSPHETFVPEDSPLDPVAPAPAATSDERTTESPLPTFLESVEPE
ncbi:MAG: TolC family protein [Planctomycetales bacterium]|nr:TolC family protein [Planctomycetales bacterium]